jgi:hypothetical protein
MAHMASKSAWTLMTTMITMRRVEDCIATTWLVIEDGAVVTIGTGEMREVVGSDELLHPGDFSNRIQLRGGHILAVDFSQQTEGYCTTQKTLPESLIAYGFHF